MSLDRLASTLSCLLAPLPSTFTRFSVLVVSFMRLHATKRDLTTLQIE